ncbi:unnamed protein product [Nyctereutes procyonoides]|uniref:Olfactory receptor n=1 Tax=Nyctereutes procyonoides TaxID=34880 RepID=A0A811ZNH6_NYCPR|nr:unnamed protein product [Nyctereutes procyonoides]
MRDTHRERERGAETQAEGEAGSMQGARLTKEQNISYNNCVAQLFFILLLGVAEFYLLAAMSYDRYVIICKPLHYPIIMNSRVCYWLVLSSWLTGFLIVFPPLLMGLKLDFCASKTIDHFMCETSPILQISCIDTHVLELMFFIFAVVTLVVTLVLVALSYTCIMKTIMKFPSKKAFSTCSSHMIVISPSYGSCIFMYLKPSLKQRISLMKGVAVLNTSVAPLLNPFIYTLRKQQVKQAFYFSVPLLGIESHIGLPVHGACFSLCLCLCLSLSLSLCAYHK